MLPFMKRIIILFCGMMCIQALSAQTITRQVIASMGQVTSQLSATVGQSITATAITGSFILTQGFQQSSQMTTGIEDKLKSQIDYTLYPNPVRDLATLELTSERPMELVYDILDSRGRKVQVGQQIWIQGTHTQSLDLSSLASGYYLLRLSTTDRQTIHNIRFAKRN